MFRNFFLSVLLMGAATSVFAATNRPSGYTTICKTNQTCSVSFPTYVAFGASGKFTYKMLDGTFVCSVATFGVDPEPCEEREGMFDS